MLQRKSLPLGGDGEGSCLPSGGVKEGLSRMRIEQRELRGCGLDCYGVRGGRGIDVAEVPDVVPVYYLMYIVEGMCAARKGDIPLGQTLGHHLAQCLGRRRGQEVCLVLLGSKHAADDALHFLVARFAIGCLLRVLRGEDDLHALFPGCRYLLQVAQRDDFNARKHYGGEVLVVHRVVHVEQAVGCGATVVEHLGMKIGEVYAEVVGQVVRYLRIVRARHVNTAFVVALRPVEHVARILCLNGIEHSHIGHMSSLSGQHIV